MMSNRKDLFTWHSGQPPTVSPQAAAMVPPPPPSDPYPGPQLPPQFTQYAPATPTAIQSTLVYPSEQLRPNRGSNFNIQQPPEVAEFDPSVPPPSFYQMNGCRVQHNIKRPLQTNEAGPSKIRKVAVSTSEPECSMCVQKEQSIGFYKNEHDRLQNSEELQNLTYRKKLKHFEEIMAILKANLPPVIFKICQIFIEDVPQQNTLTMDVIAQLGQLCQMENPATDNNVQLIKYFLNLPGILDTIKVAAPAPPSSARLDESILQTLSAIQKRLTAFNPSTSHVLRPPVENLRHVEADRPLLQLRQINKQEAVANTAGSNSIRFSNSQKMVEQAPSQLNYRGPEGTGPRGTNFGNPENIYTAASSAGYSGGSASRYNASPSIMYAAEGVPGPSGMSSQYQQQASLPGVPSPSHVWPDYGSYFNLNNAALPPPPPPPQTPNQQQDNSRQYHQYPPYPPYY